VIREGLRLLREKDILFQERLKRLGDKIDRGMDEADNGEFVDPHVLLKKSGIKQYYAKKKRMTYKLTRLANLDIMEIWDTLLPIILLLVRFQIIRELEVRGFQIA